MKATDEIKKELGELVEDGNTLLGLLNGPATSEFITAYQNWYTRGLKVVALLGKDRLEEFIGYYLADSNRINLVQSTYTIQDFITGVTSRKSTAARMTGENFAEHPIAMAKYSNQLAILRSLSSRIDSVLSDVIGHLFVELQDEELKVASQLTAINLRAAGAVAGVVLERHLQRVAANHSIVISKSNPTVSDLNDPLKNGGIYDIVNWRKIQHLADIRNYCDHKKEREPTAEEVKELIEDTDSLIKTIF